MKGLKKKQSNVIALEAAIRRERFTPSDNELNKKDKKALTTYFGVHADSILTMLDNNNQDGALTSLKKHMLKTTIRVLPYAEQVLLDSGTSKGTYQFTTLINTLRELIADIQADNDKQFIADSIINGVIKPAYIDIAENIVSSHHDFMLLNKDMIREKHLQAYSKKLRGLATTIAADLRSNYSNVRTQIHSQLKG